MNARKGSSSPFLWLCSWFQVSISRSQFFTIAISRPSRSAKIRSVPRHKGKNCFQLFGTNHSNTTNHHQQSSDSHNKASADIGRQSPYSIRRRTRSLAEYQAPRAFALLGSSPLKISICNKKSFISCSIQPYLHVKSPYLIN